MNTPEHASDSQIARLLEAPITNHEKLADLTAALRDAKAFDALNPSFKPMVAALDAIAPLVKPEIDLRRRYDIHVEYEGAAPKHAQFQAIDQNSYDGAPDSHGISTCIGYGETRKEAVADLLEQIAGFDEAKHSPRVGHLIDGGSGTQPPEYADAPEVDHGDDRE